MSWAADGLFTVTVQAGGAINFDYEIDVDRRVSLNNWANVGRATGSGQLQAAATQGVMNTYSLHDSGTDLVGFYRNVGEISAGTRFLHAMAISHQF